MCSAASCLTQVKAAQALFAILFQSKEKAGAMDAATPIPQRAEIAGHGWEAYCAAARVDSATLPSFVPPIPIKPIITQQKAKDADRHS